jgi:hypothetical protein
VAENLQPLKALSDQEQAAYANDRDRRLSLAGLPDLFQTMQIPIPTATVSNARFPDRDVPITFWTAIRITDAAPAGLIFEVGDGATALAAWVDGNELIVRAGNALAADRALAVFDNTVDLPLGVKLDLVFAVRPGDGRVRVWGNGKEIARDTAANGQLPLGWASASDGAFAAAATGALPADVTQTGAPSNFDVILPLSVYVGSVPRHFV